MIKLCIEILHIYSCSVILLDRSLHHIHGVMWNHHCSWQVNKLRRFCSYQLQVFSSLQFVHVPMNKKLPFYSGQLPQKNLTHHPDTFITTQEH